VLQALADLSDAEGKYYNREGAIAARIGGDLPSVVDALVDLERLGWIQITIKNRAANLYTLIF